MSIHGREVVSSITVQPELALERVLSLEIVRVTERAAVSAASCERKIGVSNSSQPNAERSTAPPTIARTASAGGNRCAHSR
jgi:hypothetical protein